MLPFPVEFPTDSVRLVLSYLSGNKPTVAELHNALWNVWGYAAGQFHGDPQVKGDCPLCELTDEQFKEALESLCYRSAGPQLVGDHFDWRSLLQKLQKLLLDLLLDRLLTDE